MFTIRSARAAEIVHVYKLHSLNDINMLLNNSYSISYIFKLTKQRNDILKGM
jgi:hypothetical protein